MQKRILALRCHRFSSKQVCRSTPKKSSILLRFTGSQLKKWLKSRTTQVQSKQHLSLGTPFKPVDILLTQILDYLGTISYCCFEDLPLKKRKKAARGSVTRLSKFLFSKKGLSMKHRGRMYLACIRSPCFMDSVEQGYKKKSLLEMRRFEIRHLRAIARSPRHLSHETNVELYERLEIKECGQALLDLMSNRVASLKRHKTPYHGKVDILLWQKEKLQQLQEVHKPDLGSQSLRLEDSLCGQSWSQPDCCRVFDTASSAIS